MMRLVSTLFGRVGETDRTISLLTLRFVLVNLLTCALTGVAFMQGWIAALFAGSAAVPVAIIVCVFTFGLFWCFSLIGTISGELDGLKSGHPREGSRAKLYLDRVKTTKEQSRTPLDKALALKLQAQIVGVRHVANSLVFLGLIGTVVGFIIALNGVDPSRAGDASSVAPMVATLIDGMGLALSTTLVGSVLNLWLMSCYRILEYGSAKLLAELLERGSTNGG